MIALHAPVVEISRALDHAGGRRGYGGGKRMRFAFIARDGADPEAKARRLAVRPAHLERVAPFVERGRVLIGGAILDEVGDMVGSVLLTDFASREEVEAWVAEDPYVTGGVWKEIEVLDFRPAVGAWLPDD
jgi:uncharacterized protein